MRRRTSGQPKLQKKVCEICGYDNPDALNVHHIIPKEDERCTADNGNLAVLCHNDHDLVHSGFYTISGRYQTTAGYKLFWFKEGEEPPLEKKHWLIKENPLVIRGKRGIPMEIPETGEPKKKSL